MAKFFFKKDNDSNRPMHSQLIGIIWISVVLLLIAGLAIFLPRTAATSETWTDKTVVDTAVLSEIEDSVYRAKRHFNPHHKAQQRTIATSEESRSVPSAPPVRRQPLMVELNSADTTTLQLLHGIGPTYARRIVRYRDRLGGFTSKRQLLEVYGITPQLLENIEPYITIDTLGINKIDINSIPLKQLIKHPYIEYYQARDIVTLRNSGRRFNCSDDLRAIPSMADSTLQRLLPYIDFGITQ